jgi:broad specificity phosphatase PhoE
MNKKSHIYLVRHAHSSQNTFENDPNRPLGGQLDVPLSEKGKAQAQQVAQILQNVPFTAGISSDLLRAEETARVILEKHQDIPLMTTPLLRERYYGDLEATGTEYMFHQNALHMRAVIENLNPSNRKLFAPIKGMETDQDVVDRLTHVLFQATKDFEEETVLIVSHGNVMRTLLVHLGFGNYQELRSGTLENTCIIKLFSDGKKLEVAETYGVNKGVINPDEDRLTEYVKFYIHCV